MKKHALVQLLFFTQMYAMQNEQASSASAHVAQEPAKIDDILLRYMQRYIVIEDQAKIAEFKEIMIALIQSNASVKHIEKVLAQFIMCNNVKVAQ